MSLENRVCGTGAATTEASWTDTVRRAVTTRGGGEGNGFEGAGKVRKGTVGGVGTGGTGGTSWLCREDNDKLLIEKFIDFAFFKEKDRLRVGGACADCEGGSVEFGKTGCDPFAACITGR